MTTYEKIVKGATKVKVAAPKPKYIEPILMATSLDHSLISKENFNTIMRTLQARLHDSSWSVVYKALIVIHLMIREGDKNVTLDYLSNQASPNILNLNNNNIIKNSNSFSSDIKFITRYAKYLHTRVKQFESTGVDYVRDERSNNNTNQQGGRLRLLEVDKGLLREVESVQKQIDSLLKNNFMENEINNDIVLTAFRLLVNDLLALFQELNEGVINILEHYFEMSKVDAERSLKIYKKFVDQTKFVIDYLRVAKHLEYATKLHVPTIKHAPTALTSSLEEYLDDPNFEINRRQYLAEKRGKENVGLKPTQSIFNKKNSKNESTEQQQQQQQQSAEKKHQLQSTSSDLNRHSSLVVQQTYNPWNTMFVPIVGIVDPLQQDQAQQQALQQQAQQQVLQQQAPQQQQALFSQLPSISQGQTLQSTFTGVGFGGYGSQPQQLQPQHTNPFIQPTSQLQQPQQPQQPIGLQRSNTNPFSSMATGQHQLSQQQFAQPYGQLNLNQQPQPLQAQSTNPFANTRFASASHTTAFTMDNGSIQQQQQQPQKIQASATGNNPFKVSQTTLQLFDNYAHNQQQHPHQQLKPQATAGGLEHLPTIPVFPETQQEAQKQFYFQNAQTGLYSQAFLSQQQQQQVQQYNNHDGPSLI